MSVVQLTIQNGQLGLEGRLSVDLVEDQLDEIDELYLILHDVLRIQGQLVGLRLGFGD